MKANIALFIIGLIFFLIFILSMIFNADLVETKYGFQYILFLGIGAGVFLGFALSNINDD